MIIFLEFELMECNIFCYNSILSQETDTHFLHTTTMNSGYSIQYYIAIFLATGIRIRTKMMFFSHFNGKWSKKCVPGDWRWSLFPRHFFLRNMYVLKIKDMNQLAKYNVIHWNRNAILRHLLLAALEIAKCFGDCSQQWRFYQYDDISISVQIGITNP